MSEFEKQVISMLNEIKTELNDVKAKVNTIMMQTAENAELKVDVLENKERTEKLEFEVELIKKYLRT